tara:strand:- start:1085 stop:1516 length:432 start_codon:yes stop_codon:yes gene_type:complete
MSDSNKKYFAQTGVDNIIIGIHVVAASDCLDNNGDHSELVGKQFLESIHNIPADKWVEYSLTGVFRNNPARIGGTYDSGNDVFISVKPYASWTLSAEYEWEAPVAYPTITGNFPIYWDEENQKWLRADDTPTPNWDPNTSSWV